MVPEERTSFFRLFGELNTLLNSELAGARGGHPASLNLVGSLGDGKLPDVGFYLSRSFDGPLETETERRVGLSSDCPGERAIVTHRGHHDDLTFGLARKL